MTTMWIKATVFLMFVSVAIASEYDCDGEADLSVRQGNKCLIIRQLSPSKTWPSANQTCQDDYPTDSGLAQPTSNEALQDHVRNLMEMTSVDEAHIGVKQANKSDEPAGNWQLLNGDELPVSLAWFGPNPDNWHDIEECGTAKRDWADYGLNDHACSEYSLPAALCEYDVSHISQEEQLINDPARDQCIKLHGQFLGGSCFFVTTTWHSWDDCWTELAKYNARPARIYTNEIMQKLKTLLNALSVPYVWTGLKQTRWFSDGSSPDQNNGPNVRPLLNGQTTAVNCGDLWYPNGGGAPYYANYGCTSSQKCLGEIVSPLQKYDKLFENTQVNGTNAPSFMRTTTVDQHEERACAFECQQMEGCLSFTYQPTIGNCTLYASKSDGIPNYLSTFPQQGVHFYERNY